MATKKGNIMIRQIIYLSVTVVGTAILTATTVQATSLEPTTALSLFADTVEQAQSGVNAIGGGDAPKLTEFIKSIVNILLYLVGVIAVIMIIIGGIKYVTSNGDSSAVTSAKNTIMYAIIGVVVAILAFAIVNWIITAIGGK